MSFLVQIAVLIAVLAVAIAGPLGWPVLAQFW